MENEILNSIDARLARIEGSIADISQKHWELHGRVSVLESKVGSASSIVTRLLVGVVLIGVGAAIGHFLK